MNESPLRLPMHGCPFLFTAAAIGATALGAIASEMAMPPGLEVGQDRSEKKPTEGGDSPSAVRPLVEEIEPNNWSASAQLVLLASDIVGAMQRPYDRDYYRATVPAGATLTVRLLSPPDADYDLVAFNGAGSKISASTRRGAAVDAIAWSNHSSKPAAFTFVAYHYSGQLGAYRIELD